MFRAFQDFFNHNAGFESGQGGPDTEVCPSAETHVVLGMFAIELKCIG